MVIPEQILEAKEARARRQKEMIATYHLPLISISINIPGREKSSHDARVIFEAALHEIKQQKFHIMTEINLNTPSGFEAIFCVHANAHELKNAMISIEETHLLGRFMDLDVMDEQGMILSRAAQLSAKRTCYLCDRPAIVCAREQTHSLAALLRHIHEKVEHFEHNRKTRL
ncbi:citrate lyase holo-[acyl-carrier protein] synthase [Sulfurospirillum sp. 1612]|uniref:citrate lyase holo-[acyl-carrier protein] synthase n=1 Tax=Sulfurospirillum sp. 1612 TaxID=3094835 RepID=UPI002F923C3B